MSDNVVFIDIEETLIDSLDSFFPKFLTHQIEKVREIVESKNPKSVRTFSFAIENRNDIALSRFFTIKEHIEKLLGFTFDDTEDDILTFDDMFHLFRKRTGLFVDKFEISMLFGKDFFFEIIHEEIFESLGLDMPDTITIIDDTVRDRVVDIKGGPVIEFINIKNAMEND